MLDRNVEDASLTGPVSGYDEAGSASKDIHPHNAEERGEWKCEGEVKGRATREL